MKVSFIATVYNERNTLIPFLESVISQSKLPNEIVITDADSTDGTWKLLKKFKSPKGVSFKLLRVKGNRSIGRNKAIYESTGSVIAISDAGCILDRNWLREITSPLKDKKIKVVAGFYKGLPETTFEACLTPYVLVSNPKDGFLPSSRSMAIRRETFELLGGFPEKLNYSEDYYFARKMKKAGVRIAVSKRAIVGWVPRKNIVESFLMFFNFAVGDVYANIFRPKVFLIFIRYFIFLITFFLFFKEKLFFGSLLLTYVFVYLLWIYIKNFKFVKNILSILYLPMIQITSDFAVLLGTTYALIKRF